jgi:hypothetical protein
MWLILYSYTLGSNEWNGLRLHYAVIVILKLIDYFTGLTYGPRRLVSPAVLRMPEPCMWSMCATFTFWRTSQRLKTNDWSEGLCHVAQTGLHKGQRHGFLVLHSQIWIRYLHFYLPRRPFTSSHPIEPMQPLMWASSNIALETRHLGSAVFSVTVL